LGGVFVLTFLFMEANSAWGGNIPSTLAGEFCYGIGLSLSLIYLGRMFRDVPLGRGVAADAALLALVGLCHGYTLLFCVLGAGFFLITSKEWTARLAFVLKVNILAFCFMGFWIVPLLLFAPYNTTFKFIWIIESWRQVLPVILWPPALAALAGVCYSFCGPGGTAVRKSRIFYLMYLILIALFFYCLAFKIGVIDARFLPFAQVMLVLLGAAGAGRAVGRLKAESLAALALALAVTVWSAHHTRYIDGWVRWNYGGWTDKPLWAAFKGITDRLDGRLTDPRVVYEHGEATAAAGTVRAFESLPYFSHRATMEGPYIQAGLSSPFVFYIQSLVSQTASMPLNDYNYGRFDLTRAGPLLNLFNIDQYITITEESKRAALRTPGFELEDSFPPFALFKLNGRPKRYVVQPSYRPVLILTRKPKQDSFTWFRRGDLDVPVVLASEVDEKDRSRFAEVIPSKELTGRIKDLPRVKPVRSSAISETITHDEIIVHGAAKGHPLWIRVSYHPNWHVEGAEKVWRAGPSFMLVFPTAETVRLYFGRSFPDYLGLGLTILGLAWGLMICFRPGFRLIHPRAAPLVYFNGTIESAAARLRPRAGWVIGGLLVLVCGLMLYMALLSRDQDPGYVFQKGLRLYEAGCIERARKVFDDSLRRAPMSFVADRTLHYLALTHYDQKRFGQARDVWHRLETEFPESLFLVGGIYHIGLCYVREGRMADAHRVWDGLTDRFPDSPWSAAAEKDLAGLDENEAPASQ
jgi:hypothetical protein